MDGAVEEVARVAIRVSSTRFTSCPTVAFSDSTIIKDGPRDGYGQGTHSSDDMCLVEHSSKPRKRSTPEALSHDSSLSKDTPFVIQNSSLF